MAAAPLVPLVDPDGICLFPCSWGPGKAKDLVDDDDAAEESFVLDRVNRHLACKVNAARAVRKVSEQEAHLVDFFAPL